MTTLRISGVTASYDGQPVLHGLDLVVPSGSTTGDPRPVRLRQDDAAAGHRRLPGARRGVGRARRRRVVGPGRVGRARAARHRLRRPGGQPLPAPQRRRQRRLRPGSRRPARHGTSSASCSSSSGSTSASPTGDRTSCPVASSSASRWPGPWPAGPTVVLLDEPFSSLDAGLRASTREAVADALRREGVTVVLVTHDQSEALSFADQVAIMHDGRFSQVGTPAEVYDRPPTGARPRSSATRCSCRVGRDAGTVHHALGVVSAGNRPGRARRRAPATRADRRRAPRVGSPGDRALLDVLRPRRPRRPRARCRAAQRGGSARVHGRPSTRSRPGRAPGRHRRRPPGPRRATGLPAPGGPDGRPGPLTPTG